MALVIVAFVVLAQVLASVFGYLARDVARTAMGLLGRPGLPSGFAALTGKPGRPAIPSASYCRWPPWR